MRDAVAGTTHPSLHAPAAQRIRFGRFLRHYELAPARRAALVPGVYALLDVCHLSDSQQLMLALDPASRAVLKALRNDYNLYHKYRGKL